MREGKEGGGGGGLCPCLLYQYYKKNVFTHKHVFKPEPRL